MDRDSESKTPIIRDIQISALEDHKLEGKVSQFRSLNTVKQPPQQREKSNSQLLDQQTQMRIQMIMKNNSSSIPKVDTAKMNETSREGQMNSTNRTRHNKVKMLYGLEDPLENDEDDFKMQLADQISNPKVQTYLNNLMPTHLRDTSKFKLLKNNYEDLYPSKQDHLKIMER